MSVNEKSELLQQLTIDRSETSEAAGIRLWQLLVFGLLCALLAFWLGWSLNTSAEQTATVQPTVNAPSPANNTASSEPAEIEQPAAPVAERGETILNSSGYITARRMATVSSEIFGLIKAVKVEEGMSVSEGQVLAELDNSLTTVDLNLAKARVDVLSARREATQASLKEARRNHQRIMDNRFSSEADKTAALSELENLTASLASASADIRVAELEVQRQQERLADHVIRAPFAGVVTVKNAQPGEIVAPTAAGGGFARTGICTIVDMQSLEIEVDVNESFIGRVSPGQPVEASLDAYPDWVIPASVIAIIPTADRAKATVQVRIKIDLEDARILPDMGVKVGFLKS